MGIGKSTKDIDWKGLQLKLARRRKVIKANNTPRPAVEVPPKVSQAQFLDAVPGTGGLLFKICERLDISRNTLKKYLQREDWAECREALNEEIENGIERAEDTVQYLIRQRVDLNTAGTNARWYLSKVKKEIFADETRAKVTVEGGDRPIKVANLNVNIDALNLDVETKRKLLAAIDSADEAAVDADNARAAAPAAAEPKEMDVTETQTKGTDE